MATQRSILEYLTERNPDIDNRQPANKRNTTRADYFIPKQLIEWTEFRFETLQMVYGGQLMKSAREKGVTLPDYPFLVPDVDCVVNCEPATVHILTKWNHGIVTAALNAVRDTFHPCMWIPRSGKKDIMKEIGLEKNKKSKSDSAKSKLTRADSGAMSSWPPYQEKAGEMLPKDYKTYTKWNSKDIINAKVLHEDGTWRTGMTKKSFAMPIRQVYTYCVNFGCRYGCILSTGEAFIFRIRPRASAKSRLAQDSTSDKALKAQLLDDGLIEYVSIPWGNNSGGNPEEYNNMTVNLGLWFIHVLAGNHHRVQWDYPALEKETLLIEPHVATLEPVTPTKKYSTESPPRRKKRLRVFDRCSSPAKRRRSERLKEDAVYTVSFSTELPFPLQPDHDSSSESSTGSTEQSSASDTEP